MSHDLLLFCHRLAFVCFVGVAVLLVYAVIGSGQRHAFWSRGLIWFGVIGLCIGVFLGRLAPAVSPIALNPDEFQTLAQAQHYLSHQIPWAHVDGVTVGPVNSYFLTGLLALGFPPSTLTARLAASLLCITSIIGLAVFLQRLYGPLIAVLSVFPWAAALAFAPESDYQHYASELPSIALLASALALFPLHAQGRMGRLVIAGVLLGLVPFTKLQAAPLAAFLAGAGSFLILFREQTQKLVKLGVFSLAVLGPGLALLLVVWMSGALPDFFHSYLSIGDRYQSRGGPGIMHFFERSGILQWPLAVSFVLALFALIQGLYRAVQKNYQDSWFFLLLLLWVGMVGMIIMAPGVFFQHYLLFLMLIGPLMMAHSLSRSFRASLIPAHPWPRFVMIFVLLLSSPTLERAFGLTLPRFASKEWRFDRYLNPMIEQEHGSRWFGALRMEEVLREIQATYSPTEQLSMFMWGWHPELFLLPGWKMATRDSTPHMAMFDNEKALYYKERILRDLESKLPDVISDLTGAGCFHFVDREKYSLESFPELWTMIEMHYTAVEVGIEDGPSLYVRNDLPRSRE